MGNFDSRTKKDAPAEGMAVRPDIALATGAAAAYDGLRGAAPGSGPVSKALSVLSGLTTAITHDPHSSGALGYAEKGAMGAVDATWGLIGGPAAVVDTLTGGNAGGAMKSAVGGAFAIGDAALNGDTRAMGAYTDAAQRGDYGSAVKGAAHVGESVGDQLHDWFGDDYYLTLGVGSTVRDAQRELARGGQR